MKYKKLVLNSNNVGLIMQRLNQMLSSGITKFEGAWGDENPTKKNLVFTTHPSVHRNTAAELRTALTFSGPHLFIEGEGIKWYGGTVIHFGDTFYLGNNVICIKSGKPEDAAKKRLSLTKITLLSRGDGSEAMKQYRKHISHLINMSWYYDGNDVLSVPEKVIDRHIAQKDAERKAA